MVTAVLLCGVMTGLQAEVFLEDYRREELCTRRQKNMDSAFENVYHTVQQGYFSRPSSVAGTSTVEALFSVLEYKVFCHLMFSVT